MEKSRTKLRASLAALDRRLIPGSKNAAAWKGYLGWETLQQFAEGSRDVRLPDLQAAVAKLTSGEEGLELREFQQVARDARRLFDQLALNRLPDPAGFVRQQAEQLAGLLEQDPLLRDPRVSYAAEQRLELFEGIDGARGVADLVKRCFGRPNMYVASSQRLVQRAANQPVYDRAPFHEVILGTSVRGEGETNARVSVRMLPSDASARLVLSMAGETTGDTVGVNGPVCIFGGVKTCFTGQKQVDMTRDAYTSQPASFDAESKSRTRSVQKRGGDFGEKIVVAVAKRKIAEQKRQADAIASRRAARRLADGFDKRVETELRNARTRFEDELVAPFERRHAPPEQLNLSTTRDQFRIEMLQAGRGQLAADSPPPESRGADLSLRVHQSGANNLAAALIGGATISKRVFDQLPRLSVPLPDWAERFSPQPQPTNQRLDPENFQPWSLTFRRARPISFRFDQGVAEVMLHLARVQVGDDAFDGWDLIFRFRAVRKPSGWVLERAGEVDALPTGFDPASGRGLRGRQVGFRANLKEQLNRAADGRAVLPTEIPLRSIPLRNGRGKLHAENIQADAGWMTLGFLLE